MPKSREEQEWLSLEAPERYAGIEQVNFYARWCLKQAGGDPLKAELYARGVMARKLDTPSGLSILFGGFGQQPWRNYLGPF
jgi:hypothetical protein